MKVMMPDEKRPHNIDQSLLTLPEGVNPLSKPTNKEILPMSQPGNIRSIPAAERPRERMIAHGPRVLTSVELAAILIGSGSEGRSAIEVSRDLLGTVQGSLRQLATRPLPYLTSVRGIGPARAITIQAALEFGNRMANERPIESIQLRSGRDVFQIYRPKLENLTVEEFHVATLDVQHRLLSTVLVSKGLLTSALAHPREVFRHAIAENAFAVILIHNHPSGDPTPSSSDLHMTSQLKAAGEVIGIPVLDHIIIGRGRFSSFVELGIF